MATGRVPTTANSPLTTKGDLFTYDTSQARLAVGSNGETLVADSSASTGLRWQGNYAAGKNAFINGDFTINQRGVSSTTTNDAFIFDRWSMVGVGGTTTTSSQTFTPGSAPVAGYEGSTFIRQAITGQTLQTQYSAIRQKIENVRTFAGQTVTVSFYARATSGTPYLWVEEQQYFGTGGSPSTTTTVQMGSTLQLSTSWTRYSVTKTVGSLSGKTIGTDANSSALQILFWTSLGSSIRAYANATFQNTTIEMWGVQIEAGSVATPFQTATGTLAGELAACQRYYWRSDTTVSNGSLSVFGACFDGTQAFVNQPLPVTMRIAPSTLDYSAVGFTSIATAFGTGGTLTIAEASTKTMVTLKYVHGSSIFTAKIPGNLYSGTGATGYFGISAEL